MVVREVLQYPHPKLREKAQPVSPDMFQNGTLTTLVDDMLETMYATPGTVGLAAPQIGESWQVFVMDATASTTRERALVVINPVITAQSKWKFGREGCLSFPEYLITIKRARKLTCDFLDRHMALTSEELSEFEAVIFQHELDHLNGVLFIDLARNLDADMVRRNSDFDAG